MKALLDRYTCKPIGFRYSQEEIATAIAAVALYDQVIGRGSFSPDYEVVAEGHQLTTCLMSELQQEGLDVIPANVHEALCTGPLSFVANLHEGVPDAESYKVLGSVLAVEPSHLATHGLNARRIIDETDLEIDIL